MVKITEREVPDRRQAAVAPRILRRPLGFIKGLENTHLELVARVVHIRSSFSSLGLLAGMDSMR
jgi:hypothetical protein